MFPFEGINQLLKIQKLFEQTYLLLANTFKILHNFNIFDKGAENIEQTQDFEHQFFSKHSYDTKKQSRATYKLLKEKVQRIPKKC